MDSETPQVDNTNVLIQHIQKLAERQREEADEYHLKLQEQRESDLLRKDD